ADVKRERDEVHAQIAASEAEQKKVADERASLTSPELAALDARTKALTDELATIPDPFAPIDQAASSPTNGYHSEIASKDNETKWVQVDLGQAVAIDLVRLVPARPTDFRDTPGFGFPARFRVAVSNDPTFSVQDVIVDHAGEDFPNPGQRPLSVSPH